MKIPVRNREIRKYNERLFLRLIHERGVVSQSEIASDTGMQASTVFRIFLDLVDRDLIREVSDAPPSKARKGRRPSYFELNPQAAYTIGIDLSSGGASVLLVNFGGSVIAERTVSFDATTNASDTLRHLIGIIEDLLETEQIELSLLLGIGIGAPGVVDIDAGCVVNYARFAEMEGFPITSEIESHFSVPVYVHNNASVIALSESRRGRAAGRKSIVAFLLRAGVGGAYIQDGRAFVSQGTTAFEAGHMFLDFACPDDLTSPARSLEEMLSESAMIAIAGQANPEIHDWNTFVSAVSRGDPAVCDALSKRAGILVNVVRNIALLLNPEAFLVITRSLAVSELFVTRIRNTLNRLPHSDRFNTGDVVALEYDPTIACKGAADLVLDRYFSGL